METKTLGHLTYQNDIYHTPAASPSLLAKASPSLTFYVKMMAIVCKASAKAKRGKYPKTEWVLSSMEIIRALESVGIQIEVRGIEHLQAAEGACLIIGNHMSMLETMALPAIVQPIKNCTFVVKEGLLTYPVFGHVMRSIDPIPVTRTNVRQDFKVMMEGGMERLQAGISLIVFPQTTRTNRFDPAEFNSIGVKLAKRANVPIVPVALVTDAWQNGKKLKDFGKIDVSKKVIFSFGKPIRVAGRGDEEHQQIVDFIQQFLLRERGQEIVSAHS